MAGESVLVSVVADVLTYDDASKKWVPSGTSPGLAKVNLYQHSAESSFRIIAWKQPDREVVANCVVAKNFKYNQATPTFHQFRDNLTHVVYGFNFHGKEDADAFAGGISAALSCLNNNKAHGNKNLNNVAPPSPPVRTASPSVPHHHAAHHPQDTSVSAMDYRCK
jgi:enabled protein